MLIGGIPDMWVGTMGPNVLAGSAHQTRNKMRAGLRSSMARLENMRGNQELEAFGADKIESSEFNDFMNKEKGSHHERTLIDSVNDDVYGGSDGADNVHVHDTASSDDEEITAYVAEAPRSYEPREVAEKLMASSMHPGYLLRRPASSTSARLERNKKEEVRVVQNQPADGSPDKKLQSIFFNDRPRTSCREYETLTSPDNEHLFETDFDVSTEDRMSSSEDLIDQIGSKQVPQYSVLRNESEPLQSCSTSTLPLLPEKSENHYRKMRNKFGSLVSHSRKKLDRLSTADLSRKIQFRIWNSYDNGEIMRVDRMLVLVKHVSKANIVSFSENEQLESRVLEFWKEHYVVLRKTDDPTEPFLLELYDSFLMGEGAKTRPQFRLKLSQNSHILFYSYFDKTLSISNPDNSGTIIYILRPKNLTTSYRWLFFVQQILKKDHRRPLNVVIPDLNLSVKVAIPDDLIAGSLAKRELVRVQELEKGYEIEHTPIIEYTRKSVLKMLEDIKSNPAVSRWIKESTCPWICFRDYDRLEWISDNSEMLYVKYMLLSPPFHLEMRDRKYKNMLATTKRGMNLFEPMAIEGFLSRLTNFSGGSTSHFRSFHKVSYFFSCDNLLFFTKFFKGMPPSPDNIIMKDNLSLEESRKIPSIYTHDPYPLDEREHITWLRDEDFEQHDRRALYEFVRKSQQLLKAEAMIDMTKVKDIRPIPFQHNRKTQNLLLCMVWYSSSHINDETILDAAFEMELKNGALIRLQASCRSTRDFWIEKLTELRDYWVARSENDLKEIKETRSKNRGSLRINEYLDSNMSTSYNLLGPYSSFAHPNVNNINCLAMSSSLLMSGYLFQKERIHSNFEEFYVILCPGFLLIFSINRRSKRTGARKSTAYFKHYMTIPISCCYVYSGYSTSLDLLNRQRDVNSLNPVYHPLPRIYEDGWKSSEEEPLRCFTLWVGQKRKLAASHFSTENLTEINRSGIEATRNPGFFKIAKRLGLTGKSIVFMARSRQERETWVQNIFIEIDRFTKNK